MTDNRDPLDIAVDNTQRWLDSIIEARQHSQDSPSLHCIDCGADNAARARIGRSRCIDCQGEYERQYAAYKVR